MTNFFIIKYKFFLFTVSNFFIFEIVIISNQLINF